MRRKFERLLQLHQRQIVFVRKEIVLRMHHLLGHAALYVRQLLLHMREIVFAHAYAYLRYEQTANRDRESEEERESVWGFSCSGNCSQLYAVATHSSTQCPAVAIQFSLIKAPPQRWVLEKPKNEVRRTDTCQGQRPKAALLPPTMRVSGRVSIGTPHSAYVNVCATTVRLCQMHWAWLYFQLTASCSRNGLHVAQHGCAGIMCGGVRYLIGFNTRRCRLLYYRLACGLLRCWTWTRSGRGWCRSWFCCSCCSGCYCRGCGCCSRARCGRPLVGLCGFPSGCCCGRCCLCGSCALRCYCCRWWGGRG